ncbi:hypothetical protein QYS49_14400 [Marivirga salinae]|uniref:Lipoprotein n=1 Tax=Marivirga salinarum TaxID=3059078 RepID=A0AA49JC80_9BACT|nr:hypothetical protein [Marivirga sp. BDSF4-3]WKK78125.2 hypothetical protein QYS49_14400 [Marivirga sp. BDSF4-3]
MRNYIFMLCSALIFLFASCGNSNSEKEASEADIKQEEQIADEVVKSSEKAQDEAEETEKEVDKLLEDI